MPSRIFCRAASAIVAAAYLFASGASLRADGDPDGSENLALESDLPSGSGLAHQFLADAGVENHDAVIFADGFESGDWGKWDEARNPDEAVLSIVDPADPRLGGACLRSVAQLDQNTGGGVTKWFQSADRLFIRFYVRFDANCDFLHHFVTLRANRGLRGGDRWSGFGGAGLKPDGDNRFSTALEPWGNRGKLPPPGTWNFYSYWHEMSASPDGKFWGSAFRPKEQPIIEKQKWICCEFMVRHNTPGQPDGEQAYWIDGELRGHWRGINWRTSETLMANALTVESYVTDRWTDNARTTVFFDNVVAASQYVGPAAPKSR